MKSNQIGQFGHFDGSRIKRSIKHTSDLHVAEIFSDSFDAIFKFLACKRKLASEQNFPLFLQCTCVTRLHAGIVFAGGCVSRIRSLDRKQKFDQNTLKGNEESREPGDGEGETKGEGGGERELTESPVSPVIRSGKFLSTKGAKWKVLRSGERATREEVLRQEEAGRRKQRKTVCVCVCMCVGRVKQKRRGAESTEDQALQNGTGREEAPNYQGSGVYFGNWI